MDFINFDTNIAPQQPLVITPAITPGWQTKRELVKAGHDAYAHIRKTPSYTPAGVLTGYAIELEDPESETGFSLVAPYVSEKYLVVPNKDVRDIAHEITEASPWQFSEDTMTFDGKNYMLTMDVIDEDVQQNVARFRARGGNIIPTAEEQEDLMTFGLMFRNSYDAKQAFDASIYVKRLRCSNGMVSTTHMARYRFTHDRSNENWASEIQKALSVIVSAPQNLKSFIVAMSTLTGIPVDQSFLREFREGVGKKVGPQLWGHIVDRWASKEEPTAYGLLNAATNILWHGDTLTVSDMKLNDTVVTGMVDYARRYTN